MSLRIGINGFGRIGRLALRSLWDRRVTEMLDVKRINDPAGTAETFAHLLEFDSVHGQWSPGNGIETDVETIRIDGEEIAFR